jgi:2-dehydropantoate 2-reductase
MRLLVIGAGSTGGYFGGRLVQAGRDVAFLVRPGRAAKLQERGLRIVSPHGDATIQPQLVVTGEISSPYAVILLTVKGFQLEAALDDMASAVGPETMILPVLNGMEHMDVLAERFGSHCLIGCVLKVATRLDDDGSVIQLAPVQELAYGELDGSATVRVRALDKFMRGAGFDARLSQDIGREMWEKWILLATLGGINCLMRGTIGDVEAAPGGAAFGLSLLDEVVSIVSSVGTSPSDGFLVAARKQLTAKGSPLASSMYRDLQGGLPVEVEQIVGDLLRRGEHAGVATPLLAAAYTHLALYQQRIDRQHGTRD